MYIVGIYIYIYISLKRGYISLRMVRKENFPCEKQITECFFVPRNFLLLSTANDRITARDSN